MRYGVLKFEGNVKSVEKFKTSYLSNRWMHLAKIWDLDLASQMHHYCKILSKSVMVGLNPLGDRAWNDPIIAVPSSAPSYKPQIYGGAHKLDCYPDIY